MDSDSYLTKLRPVREHVPCSQAGLANDEDPVAWQGLTVTYKLGLEVLTYREQFNRTAYRLCRQLDSFCSIYKFYPEFTDTGRIHYHGIYKPLSKYKAFKGYEALRRHGHIKIEARLKQTNKWKSYIEKDHEMTRKLIGRPIMIDPEFFRAMLKADDERVKDMIYHLSIMKKEVGNMSSEI